MENLKALIGRKVKGFEFKETNSLCFKETMYSYVGDVGIILEYSYWCNGFLVEFKDGATWTYPADQIENHLVEEGLFIGRKIRGFKFEERHDLSYAEEMEQMVGEIGVIKEYCSDNKSYRIYFNDRECWNYPADEIEKHLVEELPELPDGFLMEVSDYEDFRSFWTYNVFATKNGLFVSWSRTGKDAIVCWKYARPIKETVLEFTLEEIAIKFNVDKVKIK